MNREENGDVGCGDGGGGGGISVGMYSSYKKYFLILAKACDYGHAHTFIKNLEYGCVGYSFCPQ